MTLSVPDETRDGQAELLAQLRALVPTASLDGELDCDALVAALGLDESKRALSFTWPGIDRARHDARVPTTATLVPNEDASPHWPNVQDVPIEGDNLQVLKLVKKGDSRTTKLIYIGPPYHTRDTFTYNDDFTVPERQYPEETGYVDLDWDETMRIKFAKHHLEGLRSDRLTAGTRLTRLNCFSGELEVTTDGRCIVDRSVDV